MEGGGEGAEGAPLDSQEAGGSEVQDAPPINDSPSHPHPLNHTVTNSDDWGLPSPTPVVEEPVENGNGVGEGGEHPLAQESTPGDAQVSPTRTLTVDRGGEVTHPPPFPLVEEEEGEGEGGREKEGGGLRQTEQEEVGSDASQSTLAHSAPISSSASEEAPAVDHSSPSARDPVAATPEPLSTHGSPVPTTAPGPELGGGGGGEEGGEGGGGGEMAGELSDTNQSNGTTGATPTGMGGGAGTQHRGGEKSVFIRLSNRIQDLEVNVTLLSSYLDQISSRLVCKVLWFFSPLAFFLFPTFPFHFLSISFLPLSTVLYFSPSLPPSLRL